MTDDGDRALTRLFFETAHMKRMPRTGWTYAGVPSGDIESVAEHSFSAAVIAYALATMEGADPQRCAVLTLFHDTQETRITDISYLGRRYLTPMDNEAVTAQQTGALPAALRTGIRAVVAEHEAGESMEAQLAHDADKLECVAQAVDYRSRGMGDVQGFIDSNIAQLRTPIARRLAAQIAGMNAHEWWLAVLEEN